MKRLLLTFFAVVFAFGVISAQDLDKKIGVDPNVKVGKLENGMTYYIRHNEKPAGRVAFRLAVNAGSNQEDEDQRGLAHFTEHMAFNGIPGFPGNTMIEKLQEIGVRFGYDLNAYTSFDETVYEILMPTDEKSLNMGFSILHGWANGLLYDPKEIDDERGVISEEYRMGNGADDRMRKKWFPVVFTNSLYAERLPIGLIEIIQGFEPETIKRFYNEWYRPELQAVVVVGDVDVDKMEAKIKSEFGSIPAKIGREKVYPKLENNKEPLVCVATDKEAGSNTIMMLRKFPHQPMVTVGDFRRDMAIDLFNMMYASRYQELADQPGSPFTGAEAGYENFIGEVDAYAGQAMCKENQIIPALQSMMREDYRVLKYGFLQTELDRAKEELLNNYERAAKEVDKTNSDVYARRYVANFLSGDPIPGAKRELNYAKKYLEGITLEEVNAFAKEWITDENFVVVVMAQEAEGVSVPTEAEVMAVIKDKSLANVEPYVDTYKEKEIVEKESLKPGSIVSTKELPEVGAKELTLSNGIKVVTKKTDYKNDEILFAATSKGGMSLYYDCDIPSLAFASDLVDRAGIADMTQSDLQKKFKGKKIGLAPNIGAMTESLNGSTAPKDLELFCQYVNAFFTNPRKDTNAYALVMDETRTQLKMMNAQPMYKFFAKLLGELNQNDPYQANPLTFNEEFLSRVDYERAFYLYQERFANPADFTFFFTGNFDEKVLNEYLETYIASLPTSSKFEDFKTDVFKSFPAESKREKMYAGSAEQSQSWVGLAFSEEIPWSEENEVMVDVISQCLEIELLETIREKMGGVYSPMLQMMPTKYPTSRFVTLVMFSCDPNNTDKLSDAVINILKNFSKKGPKKATLAKVKEQIAKTTETQQQTNGYWHGYIQTQYLYNDNLNEYTLDEGILAPIKVKDVAAFMQKYFKTDHYIRVDSYPEGSEK